MNTRSVQELFEHHGLHGVRVDVFEPDENNRRTSVFLCHQDLAARLEISAMAPTSATETMLLEAARKLLDARRPLPDLARYLQERVRPTIRVHLTWHTATRLSLVVGADEPLPKWEAQRIPDHLSALLTPRRISFYFYFTSRALARSPEASAADLCTAAVLYPEDVQANPVLPLLRLTNPGLLPGL